MSRSSSSLPLPALRVDRDLGISMQRQVYLSLRQAITEGRLRAGVRLPSTRQLAETLGVSRNVVIAAFERLVVEGYLRSYVGSGTYVAPNRQHRRWEIRDGRRPPTSRWARVTETLHLDPRAAGPFTPGMPAIDEFPRRRWTQLVARWWRKAPLHLSGNEALQGLSRLRGAIADYVGMMRGIACSADEVIITAGSDQALHCIARLFADPGEPVLLEDPCDPSVRAVFEALDLVTMAAPVDDEGLRIEIADELRPRVAFTTPASQDPLGIPMSAGRRYQLLEWAGRTGAVIVESDRDCGLAESGTPPLALKSIDSRGAVIYVSSFAKTLLPGISLGFMIAPPGLIDLLTRARSFSGRAPSPAEQAALADFITEGDYARHLRRLQPIYDDRRNALHVEVRRRLSGLVTDVRPGNALHSIAWLDPSISDRAVAEEATSRGIHLAPLSAYCVRSDFPPGLVLGYGSTPASQM
ncbi:MAG: MocR-like pyridoxine biosynthesis transcription factor PdxR, partial [Thermoanaerobaculia bacterium]